MNEQFRKLLVQARELADEVFDYDGSDYAEIVQEKFAELIVRECLGIVHDAERGGSNEIWDNAVKFIRRDLQEHFGVEE